MFSMWAKKNPRKIVMSRQHSQASTHDAVDNSVAPTRMNTQRWEELGSPRQIVPASFPELGITIHALFHMLALVKQHNKHVQEASSTTAEVVELVVATKGEDTRVPYTKRIKSDSSMGWWVGKGTHFVSHSREQNFEELVSALQAYLYDNALNPLLTYFWIDVFSLPLDPVTLDFELTPLFLSTLPLFVNTCSSVLLVMHPVTAPTAVLHDLWCMYAVFLCWKSKKRSVDISLGERGGVGTAVIASPAQKRILHRTLRREGHTELKKLLAINLKAVIASSKSYYAPLIEKVQQGAGVEVWEQFVQEQLVEWLALETGLVEIEAVNTETDTDATDNQAPGSALSEMTTVEDANILLHAANIFKEKREAGAAEVLFERAADILRQLPENRLELAQVLHDWGHMYARGDTEVDLAFALGLLDEALDIRTEVLGETHSSVGNTLTTLGWLKTEKGDFEGGRETLERALEILKSDSNDAEVPHLVSCLVCLSKNCLAQDQFDQAGAHVEEALQVCCDKYGADHPHTTFPLLAMAELWSMQHRLGDSEDVYLQVLAIDEKAFGPFDQRVAMTLTQLAWVRSDQRKFTQAQKVLTRALEAFERNLGLTHPNTLACRSWLVDLLLVQKRMQEAVELLVSACELVRKAREGVVANGFGSRLSARRPSLTPSKADPGASAAIGIMMARVGDIFMEEDDQQMCLEAYEQALENLLPTVGVEHPDSSRVLLQMAKLYSNEDDFAKEESVLVRLVSARAESMKQPAELIPLILQLGQCHLKQGKAGEAKELFKQGLALATKLYGENSKELIPFLMALGDAYSVLEKAPRVLQVRFQALEISEKAFGMESEQLIPLLNATAAALKTKGKVDLCIGALKRSLAIARKVYGDSNPAVSVILTRIAALLRSQNAIGEAVEAIRTAVTIDKNAYGANSAVVASDLVELGQLYHEQGDLHNAEKALVKAVSVRIEVFGNMHAGVSAALNALGGVVESAGRLDDAEKFYSQALAIRQNCYGGTHLSIIESCNNLGNVYKAKKDFKKSERAYIEALRVAQSILPDPHADIATCLNNLAALYSDMNRPDQAERLYRRALEIDEQVSGKDHPNVGVSLTNLASVVKLKNPVEAEELFKRALAIDQRTHGYTHPEVGLDLHNLAVLYHQQNRTDLARATGQKALAICKQAYGDSHPTTVQLKQWWG